MLHLYQQQSLKTTSHRMFQLSLLLVSLLITAGSQSEPSYSNVIEITLGDYHYMPHNIQLIVDQPVVLRLINVDGFTPHNFTLKDDSDGLDVDVDIPAGESVDVNLMPIITGSHAFYCNKQLLWMDSHREKGMQGTLTVIAKQLAGSQTTQQTEQPGD